MVGRASRVGYDLSVITCLREINHNNDVGFLNFSHL